MSYSFIKQRNFRGIKYFYDDTGDNSGSVKFAYDCFFTREQSIKPYKSYVLLEDNVLTDKKVYKSLRYKDNAGNKYYIFLAINTVTSQYEIIFFDNNFNDITTSVITISGANVSTTRIDALEWKGRIYYITSNGLYYTDITTNIQINQHIDYGDFVFSTVTVKGYKYMSLYKDRLFLANDGINKKNDKVIWSFPFEENKFEVNNFKYFTDNYNDEITGMTSTENMMVFTKRNTSYYLVGDTEYNFTFNKLANIGCVASNSLISYEQNIFFYSSSGLYMYNNNGGKLLTYDILNNTTGFLKKYNGDLITILEDDDIFGNYIPHLNEYWLYIFRDDYQRYFITYNLITQSISLYNISIQNDLREGATTTDTILKVSDASLFNINDIIINTNTSEKCQITSVDIVNNEITVTRGYDGTTIKEMYMYDIIIIENSNLIYSLFPLNNDYDNKRILFIGQDIYEYGVNNKKIYIETYNYGWDTDEYVKFFRRLFVAIKQLENGYIKIYVDDEYFDTINIEGSGASYGSGIYGTSMYSSMNIIDKIISLRSGCNGKTIKFIIYLKCEKIENIKVQLKGKRRLW